MKFLLLSSVAFCAVVLVRAAQLTPEEEERIFSSWLKKHKLKVPHDEAGKKWKENVIKQLNRIEEHNENFRSGKVPFEQALNHMSHLHPDEFKASRLGLKKPDGYTHPAEKVTPVVNRPKRAADDIPSYWNWADKGIVHPPPYQKCSDCYAFASIGVIEAHACKNFNQCTKLSEQEAVECSDKCDGGWDTDVYEYSLSTGGCTKLSDYAYTVPELAECSAGVKNNPRARNTNVVDWKIMPNDTYTIRHHLYNQGPMFVTLHVYENFAHYSGGIYDRTDGKYLGAHAVMIVGYGTKDGLDYWILRNSWGENWGEKGYGRFKSGIDLATLESTKVSYPIMK